MKYNLWPKPKIQSMINHSLRFQKVTKIENLLSLYFPDYYPILFSSARVAIYNCLIHSKVSRKDNISIFPYASHCILDAVSRIAFPNVINNIPALHCIDYHQWGFVKKMHEKNLLIEDAVDSLYFKNSKLLNQNGKFEVWSLPKILGTSSGGILWCKNLRDYESIINMRNNLSKSMVHFFIKSLSLYFPSINKYVQSSEFYNGGINTLSTGEIYHKIKNWDFYIEQRLKRIKLMSNYFPIWAIYGNSRLPSNIPALFEKNIDNNYVLNLGISIGMRMFDKNLSIIEKKFIPVAPIPIHHDVDLSWLKNLKTSKLLSNI